MVAAVVSGAPSAAYALLRGDDLLESTRAIGTMVTTSDDDRVLLAAAIPVHLVISLGWAIAIQQLLPRKRRVLWGGLFGVGIAILDLRVIGRRYPRIRNLPLGPQIADHVLFGAVVAALTQPSPERRAE